MNDEVIVYVLSKKEQLNLFLILVFLFGIVCIVYSL